MQDRWVSKTKGERESITITCHAGIPIWLGDNGTDGSRETATEQLGVEDNKNKMGREKKCEAEGSEERNRNAKPFNSFSKKLVSRHRLRNYAEKTVWCLRPFEYYPCGTKQCCHLTDIG